MDFVFEKYGVAINLQNGVNVLNKDKFFKKYNPGFEQKDSCLLIFAKKENNVCSLSFGKRVESELDYEQTITELANANKNAGMILLQFDRIIAKDGRMLDIQHYSAKNCDVIYIFSVINQNMYVACANPPKNEVQNTLKFLTNAMKTLCPAK